MNFFIFSLLIVFYSNAWAIETASSLPPKNFFMEDRVLGKEGYFIIIKSDAETNVIADLRKNLSDAPKNKNFDCHTVDGKVEVAAHEGFERDLFFFSTKDGNSALLTMVDVKGDFSKAYHPNELDIVRVRNNPATLSLTISRSGGKKSRWGVGWRYLGASAALYIEDKYPPVLSKEQVLQSAEKINCTKI